jgi:hypothetical protein
MLGKSQDKYTTEKILYVMTEKLDKVSNGVCDESTSSAKL